MLDHTAGAAVRQPCSSVGSGSAPIGTPPITKFSVLNQYASPNSVGVPLRCRNTKCLIFDKMIDSARGAVGHDATILLRAAASDRATLTRGLDAFLRLGRLFDAYWDGPLMKIWFKHVSN
jgi:hypothetical protein